MYLMDNRILMYPSYLSNELCSLKQGNNRNVFSFIFKVDSNFNIIDDSFTIQKSKINVTIRREMGRDIDGACGQLRRSFIQNQQEK